MSVLDNIIEDALKKQVELLSECATKCGNSPELLAIITEALVSIHACVNP